MCGKILQLVNSSCWNIQNHFQNRPRRCLPGNRSDQGTDTDGQRLLRWKRFHHSRILLSGSAGARCADCQNCEVPCVGPTTNIKCLHGSAPPRHWILRIFIVRSGTIPNRASNLCGNRAARFRSRTGSLWSDSCGSRRVSVGTLGSAVSIDRSAAYYHRYLKLQASSASRFAIHRRSPMLSPIWHQQGLILLPEAFTTHQALALLRRSMDEDRLRHRQQEGTLQIPTLPLMDLK